MVNHATAATGTGEEATNCRPLATSGLSRSPHSCRIEKCPVWHPSEPASPGQVMEDTQPRVVRVALHTCRDGGAGIRFGCCVAQRAGSRACYPCLVGDGGELKDIVNVAFEGEEPGLV